MLGPVGCGTGPSSRVCARASPVQALLRGGYKCGLLAFQGGQRYHGRFGTPEEENRGGGAAGRREATAREPDLVTSLWSMLYDDNAGVVSLSPEQLMKSMGVIVAMCEAFGSPYRRPRLRSWANARMGWRSPPPYPA